MNSQSDSTATAPPSPKVTLTRRHFVKRLAAATAFSIVPRHVLGGSGYVAPSAKTTLAAIGTGGQGLQNLQAFLEYPEIQVVAVCDVNREGGGYVSWNWERGNAAHTAGREPARRMVDQHYGDQQRSGSYRGCQAYVDFRELLAKEDVDAVMIATPDHTHAVIAMAALKRRKHVYCEKPLAYSVREARLITETARAAGVVTQMGNQGQAEEEARVTCETIWAGCIGAVREVNVVVGPRFWDPALYLGRPKEIMPVPEGLNWDLWLGPAAERPYHSAYCPWHWRNWWDFGTGQLGDMGCHRMSTVFKALKLGHPVSVDASSTRPDPEVYPLGVIARFEFPSRGELPPVAVNWYDGGPRPARPKELEANRAMGGGVYYLGDNGAMWDHRIIPEVRQQQLGRTAKVLPRSPGHYREFVDACRGGPQPGSNFVDHAGLLSELCVLGNVSLRAKKRILWDGPNLKVTNDAAANALLGRDYRPGWTL